MKEKSLPEGTWHCKCNSYRNWQKKNLTVFRWADIQNPSLGGDVRQPVLGTPSIPIPDRTCSGQFPGPPHGRGAQR